MSHKKKLKSKNYENYLKANQFENERKIARSQQRLRGEKHNIYF